MELFTGEEETIAGTRKPRAASPDERFMLRALELAERGRGRTSPNPVVGAVVVAGGEVVGEGYHRMVGGPHAEVHALEDAGDARGATLYVTLEPCAHQGRTPPCADMLAAAGLARVVMAVRDPNPLVSGRGETRLREGGVEVAIGPYSELALRQNEAYVKWVTTGLPFLTLKMALSLDGKVATRTGESKWISSEESRRDVQAMRAASDAIMVGIGTVMKDNPRLTVRSEDVGRVPLRVIVDSLARIPAESNVADTAAAPTLIAVSETAPGSSVKALRERGVEVVTLDRDGRVDLVALLAELGERGVANLQVEGGPELNRALWDGGVVDKMVFYFAPRIIGGFDAPGPVGGSGISFMDEAATVTVDSVTRVGVDFKVVAYPGGE